MVKEKVGEKGGVDKALATALKQAKSKRMHFAVVVKNATEGALMVSKLKIRPDSIAMAKKETGGTKVFKGMCFVEDGKHIFETLKEPPPTLAKTIKTLAKKYAKLMIRPICRLKGGAEEEDESDETEGSEHDDVPATEGVTNPLVGQYNATLKELAPDLKSVLTMESPAAEAVKKKFTEARGVAKQGDYQSAVQALGDLRPLLETALHEASEAASQEDPAEAAWEERLVEMMDTLRQLKQIDPAAFNRLKAIVMQARAVASENKFAEAHQTLDSNNYDGQVAEALRAARVKEASAVSVGKRELSQALVTWENAMRAATVQVARVQSDIRSKFAGEADLAESLGVALSDFHGGLMKALDKGRKGRSQDDWNSAKNNALEHVKTFQSALKDNVVLKIIDDCPFASVAVRSTLNDALRDVQTTLKP